MILLLLIFFCIKQSTNIIKLYNQLFIILLNYHIPPNTLSKHMNNNNNINIKTVSVKKNQHFLIQIDHNE